MYTIILGKVAAREPPDSFDEMPIYLYGQFTQYLSPYVLFPRAC